MFTSGGQWTFSKYCRRHGSASQTGIVIILHHGAALAKLRDLLGGKAPIGKRCRAPFAASRRTALDPSGRARKTRRRSGLDDAVTFEECSARAIVRMGRRFGNREDRGNADVVSRKRFAPFIARFLLEDTGQIRAQLGPSRPIVLIRQ